MKTTPYNTGKVLIGSRYEPPRKYWVSRDMERLQTSLIAPRRGMAWELLYVLLIAAVGAVGYFLLR